MHSPTPCWTVICKQISHTDHKNIACINSNNNDVLNNHHCSAIAPLQFNSDCLINRAIKYASEFHVQPILVRTGCKTQLKEYGNAGWRKSCLEERKNRRMREEKNSTEDEEYSTGLNWFLTVSFKMNKRRLL